jgi:A/G-specific adenine glycosylase
LLRWFEHNARPLPWREDPKPYHVWVSEIMLQQTQVATVLPYYERWMRTFPTIADLAAADETQLMRLWEGLGYYRRVRSMHAAAKKVVAEFGGRFPSDFDAVISLPGVGRYTAGAVLSISGDARHPVLEGNTQRVYSRWIALRQSPTQKDANRLLWRFADEMLPRKGSGQFNQAAMELGALICVPKAPKCDACPVRSFCAAHRLGLQHDIPGRIKRIDYQSRTEFALVVRRPADSAAGTGEPSGANDEAEYLLRPLPEGSRWAGLWDFPRPTEIDTESVSGAADWLAGQLGVPVASGPRWKTIRHAVTKYRISLHVHLATVTRESEPPEPWKWVPQKEFDELPMSVTGRKIANALATETQGFLSL